MRPVDGKLCPVYAPSGVSFRTHVIVSTQPMKCVNRGAAAVCLILSLYSVFEISRAAQKPAATKAQKRKVYVPIWGLIALIPHHRIIALRKNIFSVLLFQ